MRIIFFYNISYRRFFFAVHHITTIIYEILLFMWYVLKIHLLLSRQYAILLLGKEGVIPYEQ